MQLEDIERDNLKNAPVTAAPQTQSQTYFTYPPQDQLIYNVPQQQSVPLIQSNHQSAHAAPNTAQVSAPLYHAQQQPLFTPQQQQLLYYTHTSQPVIDFAGLSLYPAPAGAYPYISSASAVAPGTIPANSQIDFYKTLATGTPGKTASAPTTLVKPVSSQIPNAFLLQGALQQPLYQQFALPQQPQQAQFYAYNSFYPLQTPTKSLLASGVKSTTPAVPIKGKDEQFIPIGGNNFRIEYPTQEQFSNYNKVRLSG